MTSKYLLIFIALTLLVVSAQGLSLTFQDANDFTLLATCNLAGTTTVCNYVQNTSGGNSYFSTSSFGNGGVMNAAALPMTYAAYTSVSSSYSNYIAYDGTGAILGFRGDTPVTGRVEIKATGGKLYKYINGVLVATSSAIAVNPSFISFGGTIGTAAYVDDVIWGDSTTTSKYIFGMPEQGYFLMKDFMNPAASGFYRVNTTDPNGTPTLIASYNFTSTFGKASGDDEILCLEDYGGACYQTYQTGTSWAGSRQWDLESFFASSAPYGLYTTTIKIQNPSGLPYVSSSRIPYIGSGASINFDANSYGIGETATMDVIISDGYYSTSLYNYHVVIQDIYGVVVSDQPITFTVFSPHIGQAQYTWDSGDSPGLQYGLIYATKKSDNSEILMNYDVCDLTTNVVLTGYVKNAINTSAIVGANVTVNQGATVNTLSSGVDGNYTTSEDFVQDAPTTITASMTGYQTYTHTFTPVKSGTFDINITLMPTTVTYSGIAIHGIARSPPYNKIIDSATIHIGNSTAPYGNYTTTTNSAGYYIVNDIANNILWDIQGSKTDFSNSTVYKLLVAIP